jgi:hypothetical protein
MGEHLGLDAGQIHKNQYEREREAPAAMPAGEREARRLRGISERQP